MNKPFPTTEVDPYSTIASDLFADRDAAVMKTVGNLDASPDDAARSLDLAQTTGVPAPVIAGDLEGFEKRAKSQMAADIVRNNPAISDYVNSHPMAAQLSSDDFGNLDKASENLVPLQGPGALKKIVDAFNHGMGEGPIGQWAFDQKIDYSNPLNRLSWAAWSLLGAPVEVPFRLFSGLLHGAAATVGESYKAAGGSEAWANRLTRDVIQGAEANLTGNMLFRAPIAHEFQKIAKDAQRAMKSAEPYVKAGHEPPVGLDPLWDDANIKQSEMDVDALMQSIKDSQKSLTRDRAPDMYAGFLRAQVGDQSIGIHADAVRALYGDKPPMLDDGVLGFVPRLGDKVITAEAVGGYVDIPMAEYIAKVDPQVAKTLEEFTRVRPTGVSKGEAKAIKAAEERNKPANKNEPINTEGENLQTLIDEEQELQDALGSRSFARGNKAVMDYARDGDRGLYDSINHTDPKFKWAAVEAWEEKNPPILKASPEAQAMSLRQMKYIEDQLGPNGPYNANIYKDGRAKRFHETQKKLRTRYNELRAEFGLSPIGEGFSDVAWGWTFLGDTARAEGRMTSSKEAGDLLALSKKDASFSLSNVSRDEIVKTVLEDVVDWIPPKFAHEAVRDVAGLAKKEQQFELRHVEEAIGPSGEAIHKFEIVSPDGKSAAELFITPEGNGRNLFVDDIAGVPHSIGPRALRNLLQQLKQHFPNAEILSGYRVSGARLEADAKQTYTHIKLAEPTASDHLFQLLLDDRIAELGEVSEIGEGYTATTIPEARWMNFERSIIAKIDEELAKLKIGDVDVEAAHILRDENLDKTIRGLYVPFENARPSILFALTADDPVGVLRHEVMHDLKDRGFLLPDEWAALEEGARTEGWLEKYSTKDRYKELLDQPEALLEEAIADAFADWRRSGKPADTVWAKVFEKIDQLVEAIRRVMRQLYGTENWKDIFDKIERGEVASRDPTAEAGGIKAAKQPELPGTRRMEDRDVFAEAAAAGMTKDQYLRYMKLIAERHREDLRLETERALKDQKRRQTEEWKKNYAETRERVVEEINERPDIAADNLLREGRLYGDSVDPVKLGSDYLTEEQRAALPKDYVSKSGAHPDDVAALVGYASGTDLVQGIIGLNTKRKESGLRPIEYNRRLIATETERQMEAKYGKLSDTILEEAKEQVLSETQLDLLHEEVLAAGLKAGAEFPITKAQMKEWVAERFKGLDAKDVSSDKFLADAGRAGRAAEDALLRADPAEAFRQKQRQYLAVAMSRLAKDFEKAQKQFDTLAERMIRKEPKGFDKDFVNWTQGMLAQTGYNIKRNLAELADSLSRSGYTSFDEFVQSKIGDGWELSVAEELRQGKGKKIEEMTTAEFMDLKESLDSLAHVGREVNKINIAGERLDFAEWKEQVLENIRSLPVRDKDKPVKLRFRYDASMTRMEEIAKDLDLREELGPLWNALIRPMAESKHTEYSMLEALSKKLKEMKGDKKWQRSLQDSIPQDFFVDPYDGVKFDLTRQDMIQIMLNFGNRSNIEKFTRGYVGKEEAAGFEAKLWDMIHRNATKEDWDFVQSVWDIFAGWKTQSAKLYYDLSGRQPKWIDPTPITTPHGEYGGGYYPIIYDRLRSNINAIEEKVAPNALFGPNYFRASPANHYAKERTGYADRIQFQTSIEQVAGRMQQLIHDIAYRRSVMDASKVVYDREIRGAIRKHYGMEYEKQLDPWLKDIANHFNNDEVANDFASAVMRRARTNLMGHALGLNLKVILSPSVAKLNPMDAMRVWTNYAESSKLAYEKSYEIPHTFRNIDRDFRERLEQTIAHGGWDKYQADAVRWAFLPVVKIEQQFRIITFVNEYQKHLAKGLSEGEASALADSVVRERHGSSGLPDMPPIMRASEGMKIATMFYGYFSAMYNWQRQVSGNVRRGEWMKGMENIWGAVVVPAAFGAVLFNQSKEGDSWGKTIAKALVLQPLSTLVFIRDFSNFFIEGNPSRTPLATLAASVSSAVTDAKNYAQGKRVKKPIQHAGNVIGLSTGLPMAQPSRTGQFLYDVGKGEQRPRNILEWARGIITGEARLKK